MNNKAKKIIRSLLFSSALAVLGSNNSEAKAENDSSLTIDPSNKGSKELIKKAKSTVLTNVIKIRRDGDMRLIASHRSHRSHSSHRSSRSGHYSSSGRSSGYSSGSSSLYSVPQSRTKSPGSYSLGDRTLKLGVYGNDVSELTNLLIKNYYLKADNVQKRDGYSVYNSNIRNAIILFQNDAGLEQTGTTDNTTISKLKNWNPGKTNIILGIRDLNVDDSGTDVNTLVNLLQKAGYAPDPSKLTYDSNGNTIMTEDIIMAIKVFQSFNNLVVTGNPDTKTINKLKSLAK